MHLHQTVTNSAGRFLLFVFYLCMCGYQTAMCNILLWVEPCMTTDLYNGSLMRWLVAMAPGVADAERGRRLSRGKVLILRTKKICVRQIPVLSFIIFLRETGKPPLWFGGAAKHLDGGCFPETGCRWEFVLHTPISHNAASAAACAEDRTPHQIFSISDERIKRKPVPAGLTEKVEKNENDDTCDK